MQHQRHLGRKHDASANPRRKGREHEVDTENLAFPHSTLKHLRSGQACYRPGARLGLAQPEILLEKNLMSLFLLPGVYTAPCSCSLAAFGSLPSSPASPPWCLPMAPEGVPLVRHTEWFKPRREWKPLSQLLRRPSEHGEQCPGLRAHKGLPCWALRLSLWGGLGSRTC